MAEAVTMREKNVIEIDSLEKKFKSEKGDIVRALAPVSLNVKENDFICIVGPSGCGKSTMLRIAAGLESPTRGRVLYRGREITQPAPERGMIFQEYSLLPWRT